MQLNYFVNDHNDLLPHPVGSQDGNKFLAAKTPLTWEGRARYGGPDEVDQRVSNLLEHGPFHQMHKGTTTWKAELVGPIGVMAAFGYVNSPDLLYCPALKRPEPVSNNRGWYLDHSQEADTWADFINGNGYSSNKGLKAGIVHQFGYKKSNSRDNPISLNVRMTDIALNWQDNDVSPVMFSCLNTGDGGVNGRKDKTYWGHPEMYLWGTSHQSEGMNDVFYDGSARWIPRREVTKEGKLAKQNKWPDYLMNDKFGWNSANAYIWSLRYAKP